MTTECAEPPSKAQVQKARFAQARWAGLSPVAIALSSCAGAHLGPVTEAAVDTTATPLIVVVKKSADWVDAKTDAKTTARPSVDLYAFNSAALDSRVETRLEKSKIVVDHSGDTSLDKSNLVLVVEMNKIDVGNAWLRDLVGFGAGKSRLLARATLLDPRVEPARHLLEFDVTANSGAQPGLILSTNPIGAGVKATSIVVRHMVSDRHENADFAANAIAQRVTKYYRARGWLGPAADAPKSSNSAPADQDPASNRDDHSV
jgi:hypothetical protein